MLKKILFSFMLIAVATVFTSCECHNDEDELVEKRLYRTYIIDTLELIHKNGYAYYDCDGLKEFFDVDINKSERLSTVFYIILAILTFTISVLYKNGIMPFPTSTDNCHKCIKNF